MSSPYQVSQSALNLGSGAITLLFKIKSATADENQGERTPQPRPTHFRYTHVNGTNLSDLTEKRTQPKTHTLHTERGEGRAGNSV